jgi:hypothetical protein
MNAVFIPHCFFLSGKMCANFSNLSDDEIKRLRRELNNHIRVLNPQSFKAYVERNGLPKVAALPGDSLAREKRLLVEELMKMMGQNPEKFQKLLDLMRSPASKKKFLSRCDCAKHPYEHAHRRRKNKIPADGSCACCGHYFSVPNLAYSSGNMFTDAELQPPQGYMSTAAELQPPQGDMSTDAELQPPQGNMFTAAELQPPQGNMFTAAELQPPQGNMFTDAELQPLQSMLENASAAAELPSQPLLGGTNWLYLPNLTPFCGSSAGILDVEMQDLFGST